MENNKVKFMEMIANVEITTGAKIELDLNDLRARYGDTLNTLSITNTDAGDPIEIYLDGVLVKYITANNGVWSFDWESGINYNFISIVNAGAGTIAATAIKTSVGRTGA